MSDNFKVLPAVMIAMVILFVIKAGGFVASIQTDIAGISPAQAAGTSEDNTPKEEVAVAVAEDPAVMETAAAPDDYAYASSSLATGFMSESEIEVLQSLASRRESLEARARELDLREKLLMATESRVDDKISELKMIEQRIEDMLVLRDEEEEAQIQSLVKVYETMKSKDAARIFETLETDVLLDVAGRMKESKMAAVMAAMSPIAAQELTVMLATRRDLPEDQDEGVVEEPLGLSEEG